MSSGDDIRFDELVTVKTVSTIRRESKLRISRRRTVRSSMTGRIILDDASGEFQTRDHRLQDSKSSKNQATPGDTSWSTSIARNRCRLAILQDQAVLSRQQSIGQSTSRSNRLHDFVILSACRHCTTQIILAYNSAHATSVQVNRSLNRTYVPECPLKTAEKDRRDSLGL